MKVEIEERGRELGNFNNIVKKTVNAKAKAAVRPCSYSRETNQYCGQGNCLIAMKSHVQSPSIKDLKTEEPKARPQKARSSEY